MELALNLAWALLAIAALSLWPQYAPRAGAKKRTQIVVLIVLIVILFPVISVTDDLQAAQNPAEADSCLRRDDVVNSAHWIVPVAATFPIPVLRGLSFGTLTWRAATKLPAPTVDHPGLSTIQRRPPPTA
jgi:hypothetical protein